jgi:hypothetical protein
LELEDLKHRLPDGHAAAGPVSALSSSYQERISEVDDLLGFPPEVLERIEPIAPKPVHPVMAVENRFYVRRHQVVGGSILTLGVPAQKDQVEVPTVGCRVGPLYATGNDPPAKPRSRRQSCEGAGEQVVQARKAERQALIAGPALTRSLSKRAEGDSGST